MNSQVLSVYTRQVKIIWEVQPSVDEGLWAQKSRREALPGFKDEHMVLF